MKTNFLKALLIFSLFLSACNLNPSTTNKDKLNIVTSFYPLYEIAHQVGQDQINLKNLVPNGTEPHDFEPSPQDLISLNQANLVIYNGMGLESWIDKVKPDLEKNGVQFLDLSQTLSEKIPYKNSTNNPEEKFTYDPHFWLDPISYQTETKAITQKLIDLSPQNQSTFQQNSDQYQKQLQDLANQYQNGFKNCQHNQFITNHAAFGYLAKRYNLTMVSISGLSPDSEPSVKTLTELTQFIKKNKINYLLTETLISPKIAETLAKETNAQTLLLNPLEGLSDTEINQGENYVTIMRKNLINLQTALQCKP